MLNGPRQGLLKAGRPSLCVDSMRRAAHRPGTKTPFSLTNLQTSETTMNCEKVHNYKYIRIHITVIVIPFFLNLLRAVFYYVSY